MTTFSNATAFLGGGARPTSSVNLGGPYQGYSPQQTMNHYKNDDDVRTRNILRNSWNTAYANGKYIGNDNVVYNRVITPFRAVNNSGDFLGRIQYVCGGPNQINATRPGYKSLIGSIISNCDNTGVPASTCNGRYVADSSDYTKFKRQTANNKNYNDMKNGGDQHNASYVPLMRIRRL
jgi:hypothetical protein